MNLELVGRLLELVAKYSWAVMFLCGFILFVPEETAKRIGTSEFRDNYRGIWWILFVFAGALWAGNIVSSVGGRIYSARRNRTEKALKKQAVIRRLESLSDEERMWIAYCLLKNTQTLTADATHHIARSLTNKGILIQGSGHILGLPFHIDDAVWEHLRQHRSHFLPGNVENDQRAIIELESFVESLTDTY